MRKEQHFYSKVVQGSTSYAPVGVSPDWFVHRKCWATKEPDEGNLHVRVCGEGAGQPVPLPGSRRFTRCPFTCILVPRILSCKWPPHETRLNLALDFEIEKQLQLGLSFRSSVAGAIHVFREDSYL